ncbi:MAG: hypothetical protein SFU57_12920 [Gemmatimonadales bacterium]|nr:hypothetical protein [Gemmatimonadales bacterium]
MTTLPDDVERAVNELRAEIDRLVAGKWDQPANAAAARILRSLAESVVLSARKLKESVTQSTHPNA